MNDLVLFISIIRFWKAFDKFTRYWYLFMCFFEEQRRINSLFLDFSSVYGMVLYKVDTCFNVASVTNTMRSSKSKHYLLLIRHPPCYSYIQDEFDTTIWKIRWNDSLTFIAGVFSINCMNIVVIVWYSGPLAF